MFRDHRKKGGMSSLWNDTKEQVLLGIGPLARDKVVVTQEAKYVESWPKTTSAWASWSRFDIPVVRYGEV